MNPLKLMENLWDYVTELQRSLLGNLALKFIKLKFEVLSIIKPHMPMHVVPINFRHSSTDKTQGEVKNGMDYRYLYSIAH